MLSEPSGFSILFLHYPRVWALTVTTVEKRLFGITRNRFGISVKETNDRHGECVCDFESA